MPISMVLKPSNLSATPTPSAHAKTSRYRVTTRRGLSVKSESDEKAGTLLCDLMPSDIVDVLEDESAVALVLGSVRGHLGPSVLEARIWCVQLLFPSLGSSARVVGLTCLESLQCPM